MKEFTKRNISFGIALLILGVLLIWPILIVSGNLPDPRSEPKWQPMEPCLSADGRFLVFDGNGMYFAHPGIQLWFLKSCEMKSADIYRTLWQMWMKLVDWKLTEHIAYSI